METSNVKESQSNPSPAPLKANFGLVKFLILSLLTFGLYALYTYARVGETLNTVAGRYDGKKTMSYWLMALIVSPLTLGIGGIVWFHNMSGRVGQELTRRKIAFSFGAGTFWLWDILGIVIVIGPFVYCWKLFKAMNLLIDDYNERG